MAEHVIIRVSLSLQVRHTLLICRRFYILYAEKKNYEIRCRNHPAPYVFAYFFV